jgi:hypothetical protein
MSSHWDEFSKSLAEESVPRRESLRRLGLVVAGTVLGPLGLESAFAGKSDPCKSFCRCRNKRQQDQCLKACKACNKNVNRLGGSCGNYFCCGTGQTSCGSYCADLSRDPYNCGACGYLCEEPGPYEYGACVDGMCQYACADGAEYCDGLCTSLDWDPDNCSACGNVCPEAAPFCTRGICTTTYCEGADLLYDRYNCGACGRVCGGDEVCDFGTCVYSGGCTGEGC